MQENLKEQVFTEYKNNNIRLINTDCMLFMATVPDKFFELAIVDPPYFSGPEKREYFGSDISKIGVKRIYKKSKEWQVPKTEYFIELSRISKKYIIWGCNYYDAVFHSGRIVWDKVNDSSDYSDCELAATNLFDHVRIFRFMWNGMLQGESATNGTKMQGNKKLNEVRIHPTQKPVALYKWLLKNYAKEGDKIFDSHLGSGSIAIACHDYDFSLVGCELDKDYYEAARNRLKNHQAQQKLFV